MYLTHLKSQSCKKNVFRQGEVRVEQYAKVLDYLSWPERTTHDVNLESRLQLIPLTFLTKEYKLGHVRIQFEFAS